MDSANMLTRMLENENAEYKPGDPIRSMKGLTILFGICGIFLTCLMIAAGIADLIESSGGPLWARVAIGFFCLLILGTFIRQLNILIVFKNDGLTSRDSWRQTCDIPYGSIQRYGLESSFGSTFLAVYTEKKKYRFSAMLVGLDYLRQQIRENVGRDKEKNLAFFDPPGPRL